MRSQTKRRIWAFAIGFCPVIASSQQASLTGVIIDRFEQTPINGAQVVIAGQTVGISGADGRYLVSNQKNGAVAVVYRQIGYGDQAEQVTLNTGSTVHDVKLIKSTPADDYWSAAVHRLHTQAAASVTPQQAYLDAWQDIDKSGIAPEAKATAARKLFAALPSNVTKPASLAAYERVDPSSLPELVTSIAQAVSGSSTLPSNTAQAPGPVAADIAATQVVNFEKTSGNTVQTKFYSDFNNTFGADATARLRSSMAAEQLKSSTTQSAPQ